MKHSYTKALILCATCTSSSFMVSCSSSIPEPDAPSPTPPALKINTTDESALTYRAKYGAEYEIQGNIIAKYPHFNLSLFSQKTLPAFKGSIHTYVLTSKDGMAKTHISCDSSKPEKKHFSLEGLHFYYHSNSEGAINIYMPPQLLANR